MNNIPQTQWMHQLNPPINQFVNSKSTVVQYHQTVNSLSDFDKLEKFMEETKKLKAMEKEELAVLWNSF